MILSRKLWGVGDGVGLGLADGVALWEDSPKIGGVRTGDFIGDGVGGLGTWVGDDLGEGVGLGDLGVDCGVEVVEVGLGDGDGAGSAELADPGVGAAASQLPSVFLCSELPSSFAP